MDNCKLPLDLFYAIAKDAEDDPSILNLRLVSRSVHDVATPFALRAVVVNDSVKSAQAVSFLQRCTLSIRSLIREVVFCGDPDSMQAQNVVNWKSDDDTSGETGRQALRTVFSGLAKFPNLQILRFNFHDCYQEDVGHIFHKPTHFARLQNEIFATLAAHPPPLLHWLTLNNLIAIPDNIYAEENFHRIFRSLQRLDISVLSDVSSDGAGSQPHLFEFWNESVAHMVCSAPALTALTVRSDQLILVRTFKDVYLPKLASLSLHQFILEPSLPESDSDVVPAILRHNITLTRLELHGCSICGWEQGHFPRPWHAVLGEFEAELRNLHEFVLEGEWDRDADENVSERDPRFNYTSWDLGPYMPWDEEVTTEELDLPALESLMAVVNSRNGQHLGCSFPCCR
ncbi:hypothetical protein K438DRAFT_1824042 [Mycena galopus ATCC 62051]|nr:hypothetical protein K438DRAFT_1824042 [Mycena galopus ATCC 62051]